MKLIKRFTVNAYSFALMHHNEAYWVSFVNLQKYLDIKIPSKNPPLMQLIKENCHTEKSPNGHPFHGTWVALITDLKEYMETYKLFDWQVDKLNTLYYRINHELYGSPMPDERKQKEPEKTKRTFPKKKQYVPGNFQNNGEGSLTSIHRGIQSLRGLYTKADETQKILKRLSSKCTSLLTEQRETNHILEKILTATLGSKGIQAEMQEMLEQKVERKEEPQKEHTEHTLNIDDILMVFEKFGIKTYNG